jgi:hypothetical protein
MKVRMVRSKVKEESVAEVEAAIRELFSAIERARPAGVHYASSRLEDGVTFVALLGLDEGVDNPLRALPEFVKFQEDLKQWIAEPPTPEQLSVVGSYGLF